jgi:hypothetical protein
VRTSATNSNGTATSVSTGFAPYELLYAQPQNIVEWILRPQTPPTHDNPAASEWMEDVSIWLADAKEAMRGCKKSVYSLGWGVETYRKYPH